jgi:DNA processing protein
VNRPAPEVLHARAAWSRLAEPGDTVAGALVASLGPVEALSWLREVAPAIRCEEGVGAAGVPPSAAAQLSAAARRWLPRLEALDPVRDLGTLERLGGFILVPEGPGWPTGLADLGAAAPLCLWVCGAPRLDLLLDRSVAIIGARACTAYGEHVTAEVAGGVAAAGWTVVSGGAYGVDAVAHRAALASDGRTVAFLAGGIDRPYPAGNARLLRALADAGGAVVSEVPPASVPSKVRFLQRNRLIAAVSRATVVVEAAWRSGALNTAAHAAGLLRPVGAVPGPVTSAASAGCHRLLRSGSAVCVTDASEVLDLVGSIGTDLAAEPRGPQRPGDGLSLELRRALDALPVRRPADLDSLARAAGLTESEVRSALGRLELAGLAARVGTGWCRTNVLIVSDGTGQV